MNFEQFVENFSNALKYEVSRTAGTEVTQLLEYKIGLVVMNGQITGYTMDKTVDSLPENEAETE
jgi:hypothetical protein